MTREELLRHAALGDDCKDGFLSSVKSTLSERHDIDVCYDSGVYFVSAFLSDSTELLNTLLTYATKTNTDKVKLAAAIASARDRSTNVSEAAKEIIAPYLAALDTESDSDHSDYSETDKYVHAAESGNVKWIREHHDITDRTLSDVLISTSIQHGQEGVISTLVDMSPTYIRKATILRVAGDICTKNGFFDKAEQYYTQSLMQHPGHYVTYSHLGAMYQNWSHDSQFAQEHDKLTQKAITNYSAALAHKPQGRVYRKVQEKLHMISTQLELLRSAHDNTSNSDTASNPSIGELLASSSGEDTDMEDIAADEVVVAVATGQALPQQKHAEVHSVAAMSFVQPTSIAASVQQEAQHVEVVGHSTDLHM